MNRNPCSGCRSQFCDGRCFDECEADFEPLAEEVAAPRKPHVRSLEYVRWLEQIDADKRRTHQDNVNDMRAKGRGTGNRGVCRRGHALVPGNLLRMGKDERGDQKWGCRECNHLRIAAKQRGTRLDPPAFCPPVDAARTTVTHSDPLLKRGVA